VPTRPPPTSTLFPYTTLFRSRRARLDRLACHDRPLELVRVPQDAEHPQRRRNDVVGERGQPREIGKAEPALPAQRHLENPDRERSEEHTSELQSRSDLVCRLL